MEFFSKNLRTNLLIILKSIMIAIGGMFFPILYIFFPNDILYVGVKEGIVKGVFVFICVMGFVGVSLGVNFAMTLMTIFLPAIILMHYMISTKRKAKNTILVGALSIFVCTGLVLYSSGLKPEYFSSGKALEDFLHLTESVNLKNFKLNASTQLALTELFNAFVSTLPATLLCMALLISYLSLSYTGRKLLIEGQAINQPHKFSYLKFPRALGFIGLIIGILSLAFADSLKAYETYVLNLTLILNFIFIAEGLALAFFQLDKIRAPRFVKFVLFLLIIYFNPLQIMVAFLGMLDSVLNFRKLPDEVI
ncbi:YybS family protein [Peptoniphilus sp. GNH]|nr:YybS family protein [Peptoniphilus sp. GNH]